MERKEAQSVGEVLRDLLEETSLQSRMEELKAIELWSVITGKTLANQTSRPYIKNGMMQVGVPNASLRNELHMNRSKLREIINSKLGKEIIKEIKFTS